MNEIKINQPLEIRALDVLDSYSGGNNYIIKLKIKKDTNKKFYPTRNQAEYILAYKDSVPKVARKWVELDMYFANKFADEKLLTEVPTKIWVEKLLVEKDTSYHIWGKYFEHEELYDFWIPKSGIIKDNSVKVVIDYEKYSHRPPLSHQKEGIEKLVGNKKYILADDMGLGKALEINTLIYTPNGTKKIGELIMGDKVIGDDGLSYNVTGVFPQGKKELYRITFNDGYSILCCEDHIWNVSTSSNGYNNNRRKVLSINLTTKQLMDKNSFIKGETTNSKLQSTYYKIGRGNSKWQIPITKPVLFEQKQLPINPYLLGLLLGDGGISNGFIRFSSTDDEIIDNIKELLPNDLEIKKIKGNNCDYSIVTKIGARNSLTQELKKLKLMGCTSSTKFIPEIYKYSSVEDRLLILQGLMDTDGTCLKSRKNKEFAGTEYSTISERLADDVAEIVQSLGGIVRKKSRITSYTYKGEKKEGKKSYRLNIKLQGSMNPFKLKRKMDLYNEPTKYKVARYIKNIEYEGVGEAVCISVDSPNKLYVAEHCIVTHNTTSTIIAALETGVEKVLIISPASLKINWQREIENYTDRSVAIIDGKKWESADFVIVNYDILKNFHDPKNREESQILNEGFGLVIIDEAHYIQNTQAQRTKLINDFVKKIDRLWLLTGTPMTSRPINYYNLLSLIDSPVAMNWMAYVMRYCEGYQFKVGNRKVWNVNGASNLEELRDRTSRQVLRRLKTDVLDLPEKIITPVYLKLKSYEYERLMGEYYDWYDNSEESTSLTVQFTKLMKVRQVISEEKVKSTIELCENIIEQGKKVIVFTNFTNSLNSILSHFGKKAVGLDGSMPQGMRQDNVDKFQNDENIMVFVGNIKAAGVGITLTSAEVVVMNDLSFVPSDHSQAEDRAYRYGQKNNVLVYYPIFDNTIEGIIYNILQKKKNIFETVMGDNLSKGDMVEEIMNMINTKR